MAPMTRAGDSPGLWEASSCFSEWTKWWGQWFLGWKETTFLDLLSKPLVLESGGQMLSVGLGGWDLQLPTWTFTSVWIHI